MLLICLMQRLKEHLRVCQIQLLVRISSSFLKPAQDMLRPLTLLFILQVVDAGSEEEPDAMGEEKVNFAGIVEYITDLIDLRPIQLRVQVETAELGNEKLQVSSGCALPRNKVWIQAYTDKQVICMWVVSIELDKSVEYLAIWETFFLECLQSFAEIQDDASLPTTPLLTRCYVSN